MPAVRGGAAVRSEGSAFKTAYGSRQTLRLPAGVQERVQARLCAWQQADLPRRMWDRDPTLWSARPLPELSDRLGWLALPETMRAQSDALEAFAGEVAAAGMPQVVLLGMGGSSLAPEVFQRTFAARAGHPDLLVLDSTHPGAVRAAAARLDLRRTLFLVSSKSGTTMETLALFRYFWHELGRLTARPGSQFVAITDPGTPLERLAADRGFCRTFLAPPDVGGRYSALTVFGLVPASLIGVEVGRLLERARAMAGACGPDVAVADNPGLLLGAVLGELALAGRDKATIFTSPALAALPSWIEQLVAESTGKDGQGIVPVVDEPPAPAEHYGTDRGFVLITLEGDDSSDLRAAADAWATAGHPVIHIHLHERVDLGGEFFRWEVATAASGLVLGIHPFNQPDVQLAKDLAHQAMVSGPQAAPQASADEDGVAASQPEALAGALRRWMTLVRPGDYVGLQAYLAPSEEVTASLAALRLVLRDRLRVATTVGYGPRFLHSTGQLHKGGPDSGVFLQLVDDAADDLPVPETDYTFGALIRAQALGDFRALQQRGRRVVRVDLGRDPAAGLKRVLEAVRG